LVFYTPKIVTTAGSLEEFARAQACKQYKNCKEFKVFAKCSHRASIFVFNITHSFTSNVMTTIKEAVLLFLKGLAMGAANVIPGVSGGTIAFITGIFDKLIKSLKSFDVTAAKLLFSGKIKEFIQYTNIPFLAVLLFGVFAGIISFGKLLKWATSVNDHQYEILVWAFFFGLIVASVYSVGRTIKQWSIGTVVSALVGVLLAVSLVLVNPAGENEAVWYLVICGVMATASMLLPGLSGSFVLILLGNYYLIMINAVADRNMAILLPVMVGAIIGFVILSRGISFLLDKFENPTIGLLTGFVFGSLATIWPWKSIVRNTIEKADGTSKEVIEGFEGWYVPGFEGQDLQCYVLIILGAALVWGMEYLGNKLLKTKEA